MPKAKVKNSTRPKEIPTRILETYGQLQNYVEAISVPSGANCIFLDRHQVWRSHDPTCVQTFDFCEEKKDVIPPFFKEDATFSHS